MTHFSRGSYALVPDYGLILHLPCYKILMDNSTVCIYFQDVWMETENENTERNLMKNE